MRYLKELRHPKQQKSLYLLLSLESFFIAWALMQITRVGTRHLLTALFFLLGLVLLLTVSQLAARKNISKATRRTALGMGVLFAEILRESVEN